MDQATHNKIVSFIWGIADDVLRDLFKRGKYPDVILPMCVIRRMDAVLEPTKQKVLDTKKVLDEAGITEQRAALCDAAGQAFYNTSKFKLRDLKSRGSQQQLLADFEDYLNGFSPNVQDILDNFKFRNQLQTLSKADAIGTLINKFLDPDIDLSPAGIDNHSMGTVFEELVRKFNEENNEEAGEHWTPRDAVRLMANLVFLPIEAEIRSGTYLLYDCACGTGGMLTVGEETLTAIGNKRGQQVKCLLYGQEINPETYAVCKADMLLKGEGESADHIVGGAEWSTLSHDAFPAQEFDFMLANPPYGKSWKKDLEAMGGKDAMRDPRFKVMHQGEEFSLVTRSSDGQMLFLANMASKMNDKSALGSRIAEVHNGSSLFTGDASQGESNIRRWLIENDWLEAIVALPLNLFYNTGIATYVWVLSNRKPAHRQGKVQLIDASQWFKPLRKNLGLNRAHPQKHDCFVLDFQNNSEAITFAFQDYYRTTLLAEETDPNKLHDLKAALDAAQVYSPEQVQQVVGLFLGGADRDTLDPILDSCVAVYVGRLDEDGQVDFKSKAKVFCRTYAFLSSVIPYSNAEWEKLSIFLDLLTPKLPAPKEDDLAKGILEAIDMDSYRVEKKAAMKITLADQDAEIEAVPTDGGGRKPEPELDRLSNILKTFNEQFGTLFTDTDRVAQRIRDDIAPKVAADAAYRNARENTPHTAHMAHDQALAKVMQHLLKDDTQVYKQFVENESFKRFVGDMVYEITSQ